ncbi:pre-mRNA branch site p14 protein-like [Tropilaelaps mercedesae]|uniref:Splicing factor 3B subunit 6 n=1 Tax=Tropilaelaps mercedesae TaxID=418985 RepID=A0A1V9XQB2_9ACAR|nr:pre-mRNA branch site p14 protein-like [Tropilaelaps mercedesae]
MRVTTTQAGPTAAVTATPPPFRASVGRFVYGGARANKRRTVKKMKWPNQIERNEIQAPHCADGSATIKTTSDQLMKKSKGLLWLALGEGDSKASVRRESLLETKREKEGQMSGGKGRRIGETRLAPEVNRILYVRNLPYKISTEEMYDIFGKYGGIRQIRVGNTAETRGTAFVVYEDIFDAKNACEHLSGFNVCNRYLVVLYYQPNKAFKKVDVDKKKEEMDNIKRKYGMD